MTSNELENRFATIEELLLKLTVKKPTAIQRFWKWSKPYIIPFMCGMLVGGLFPLLPSAVCRLPSPITNHSKAALGGAAIPFPNGDPLPMPSSMQHDNSTMGSTDSMLKSSSAQPSQVNPQADNGQMNSQPSFHRVQVRKR